MVSRDADLSMEQALGSDPADPERGPKPFSEQMDAPRGASGASPAPERQAQATCSERHDERGAGSTSRHDSCHDEPASPPPAVQPIVEASRFHNAAARVSTDPGTAAHKALLALSAYLKPAATVSTPTPAVVAPLPASPRKRPVALDTAASTQLPSTEPSAAPKRPADAAPEAAEVPAGKRARKLSSSPTPAPSSAQAHAPKAPVGKPEKPKTAFYTFYAAQGASFKEQHPGVKGGELASLVSAAWKKLGAEEKAKYATEAAADKERYAKECEEDGGGSGGGGGGSHGAVQGHPLTVEAAAAAAAAAAAQGRRVALMAQAEAQRKADEELAQAEAQVQAAAAGRTLTPQQLQAYQAAYLKEFEEQKAVLQHRQRAMQQQRLSLYAPVQVVPNDANMKEDEMPPGEIPTGWGDEGANGGSDDDESIGHVITTSCAHGHPDPQLLRSFAASRYPTPPESWLYVVTPSGFFTPWAIGINAEGQAYGRLVFKSKMQQWALVATTASEWQQLDLPRLLHRMVASWGSLHPPRHEARWICFPYLTAAPPCTLDLPALECSAYREPRKRACVGCHSAKVLCSVKDDGSDTCARCRRLGITCVPRDNATIRGVGVRKSSVLRPALPHPAPPVLAYTSYEAYQVSCQQLEDPAMEELHAVGKSWITLTEEEQQRWIDGEEQDLRRYIAECSDLGVEPVAPSPWSVPLAFYPIQGGDNLLGKIPGFTASQLIEAGFTASQLKVAGYNHLNSTGLEVGKSEDETDIEKVVESLIFAVEKAAAAEAAAAAAAAAKRARIAADQARLEAACAAAHSARLPFDLHAHSMLRAEPLWKWSRSGPFVGSSAIGETGDFADVDRAVLLQLLVRDRNDLDPYPLMLLMQMSEEKRQAWDEQRLMIAEAHRNALRVFASEATLKVQLEVARLLVGRLLRGAARRLEGHWQGRHCAGSRRRGLAAGRVRRADDERRDDR